jgi:hypothetical protein
MRPPIDHSEFYIGYEPPMPPRLARFVRRVVLTIVSCAVVWGFVLVDGHSRLEGGNFAFGQVESFAGRLAQRPFPALIAADGTTRLLVAPGKHGADGLVLGSDGMDAKLSGRSIQRGHRIMIEVDPGSIVLAGPGAAPPAATPDTAGAEPAEVTGEIVDTKCFLGVMVPGAGKTHRACASLCLRGGVPPALHVQDRDGRSALFLLVGPRGESLTESVTRLAARAITMAGTLRQEHGWQVLWTDAASWRPANPD